MGGGTFCNCFQVQVSPLEDQRKRRPLLTLNYCEINFWCAINEIPNWSVNGFNRESSTSYINLSPETGAGIILNEPSNCAGEGAVE